MPAPGPLPELPAGQHTRRSLLDQGVTVAQIRRLVRNQVLVPIARGIYLHAPELEPAQPPPEPIRAAALLHGLSRDRPHAASHATAASLLGLFGQQLRLPVHMTSPAGSAGVRRASGVISHVCQLDPLDTVRSDQGILLTSPVRTWVDLSLTASLRDSVIWADQLLRPPRPEFGDSRPQLAEPEDLWNALSRRGRVNGLRTVRAAAGLARVGADSPRETELRLALQAAGLPEADVNAWVISDDGTPLFQPDLSYLRYKVCVQYEGHHHSALHQVERDVSRAELAADHGWKEVRITNRHRARQWQPAIMRVAQALRERGWHG